MTKIAALATRANAVLIDFNGLAELATVSTQFTGVTFTPGFAGTNPLNGLAAFATTTDMRVTSSDYASFGSPPASAGKTLHTFGGWNAENEDPVFTITFAQPISAFSTQFYAATSVNETGIFAFRSGVNGTFLGSVTANGVIPAPVLSLNALTNAGTIVITPGSFDDWVAVDDINYTSAPVVVPEGGSLALLIPAFAALTGIIVRCDRVARA